MSQEEMIKERDEAMAAAEAAANAKWVMSAEFLIRQFAATHRPFTTDDVIEALERHEITTKNLSALGPIMRRARREKVIVRTGRTVPSRIKRRHRDLVEWVGRW
jgi:hypothetical protein